MKISIKNIISSVTVLLICNYSIGQDSCRLKLIEEYQAKYSDNYNLYKKVILSGRELASDFSVVKFRAKSLKGVESLVFSSKKFIAPNTRLWFTATVYQYASNLDALGKFKELSTVKQSHDESVLGKDWNYVVLYQNLILRIKGDCSHSEDDWNSLKNSFVQANLKVTGSRGKDIIACQCGGYCY